MPTTRSRGRNEPLQRLETPPKRQRKQRTPRPLDPQGHRSRMRMRIHSPSPESRESTEIALQETSTQTAHVSYIDASTQTENVFILTTSGIADLRDRQAASAATKRTRDDESEEEPTSKRQQFSTPQNTKSNNLWMFGERANGDHPRTAPSKTLAASSSRRPVRGPLSKRSNFVNTPQRRLTSNSTSCSNAELENIKPIQQAPKLKENEMAEQMEAEPIQTVSETQAQAQPPQTPRGGLFGSLRGMVHKGWDMAASFSPLTARTASTPSAPQTSNSGTVNYPQLQPTVQDGGSPITNSFEAFRRQAQTPGAGRSRHRDIDRAGHPASEPAKRHSRYDHLHYVSADKDSVNKAMNGEIEPEHAPIPLSPSSRLRAQNPQLSDAAIESILKRRERKAAMDEERFGPPQLEEEPKVAPLFGPDSHYNRGTVDPRFLPPTPMYGSGKKRKLQVEDEDTPRRNRGFSLDDEDIDAEIGIQSFGTSNFEENDGYAASPSKRQRTTETMPATPRSALKKPGGMGSIGRKSVTFGGSITRDIRYHYGPAGQYKGSTFADDSPKSDGSPSSIDHTDVISPTTQLNTFVNSGKRHSVRDNFGANIPHIDFTLRDPNDDTWRPSLVNPRPGTFRVPDVDEEDPDESMSEDTPEQPQTPRMSHAELPAVAGTTAAATTSSAVGDGSTKNGTTDLALDKARSRAEKYKPKSSSRLSEVAQARSRSPSPERDGHTHTDDEDELAVTATPTTKSTRPRPASTTITAPAVRPIGAPPQPFVPAPLDNTKRGSDGLTDQEREHEYDDWAANLHWDAPQTYEDAGTASAFIHNLIRKNWGEEDSRRSEAFWAEEFDEVDRAMELAKSQGHQLILITGMEDVGVGMEGVEVA